jgi:hypothetical protein
MGSRIEQDEVHISEGYQPGAGISRKRWTDRFYNLPVQ